MASHFRPYKSTVPSEYGPLNNVVASIRGLAERTTKQSRPVTPPILRNLLSTKAPLNAFASQLHTLQVFRIYALIAFQSMLRSSNLIPISRSDIHLDAILTWGSIRPTGSSNNHGYIIYVRKSKTIQNRECIHNVPLAACHDKTFCPVHALDVLLDLYGRASCTVDTPVFRLPSPSGSR